MNQTIAVSLLKHFEGVEDPRDNRGKEHNLLDIIVIAICAVIQWGRKLGRHSPVWRIKARMAALHIFIMIKEKWERIFDFYA